MSERIFDQGFQHTYDLDSANEIQPYRQAIREDAQRLTVRTLDQLFGEFHGSFVSVDIRFGDERRLPREPQEPWSGRFEHSTHRSGFIKVFSGESAPTGDDLKTLYFILHHEIGHAARYLSPGFTKGKVGALERVTSEGVSEVFARERTRFLPKDSTYQDVHVAADSLLGLFRRGEDVPIEWVTRKDRLMPYKIGMLLVDKAMRSSGATIEEMLPMPSREIIERID